MARKPPAAGDPYTPAEFVPGLVAMLHAGEVDKGMQGVLGDKVKCYSCNDRAAVQQPYSFLCLGKRDGGRPGRTFWAPLFPSPGDNKELIDTSAATGHPTFLNGAYHFAKDQVWVIEDDLAVDVAKLQTSMGKKVLCDLSKKSNRNLVPADCIPAWDDFSNAVRSWSKQAASSAPKENTQQQPQRDPSDASRLFRDFKPDVITQRSATPEREQKRVKRDILDQFPRLEEHINDLLPNKEVMIIEGPHGATLITHVSGGTTRVVFFQHNLGPFMPTLQTLHRFPWMLPQHQVDIGGCKFVVSGANLMCQGLTSEKGRIADGVDVGAPVAVYVEGKRHAAAVGLATLSSKDIAKVNKGVCVTAVHHLGDGLWLHPTL